MSTVHSNLRPFLRRLPLALALAACVAGNAWAFDPFVVRDIRVEGLQRIEPGTVFTYLPVKVGESMNPEKAQASIRALFATGFFKDVQIEADGDVLVVAVEERPAIGTISITGTKEFEVDTLRKSLREIGIAEARIFDRAVLDRAEQELKRQYLGRGKYDVKIVSTITPLERNRVAVSIAVDEGDSTSIKEIRIVGTKAYSESELKKLMSLTTPGWFTWYTKSDQYSRQKLQGDLEALRSFYLNRGYLEFSVDSSQVSISPDRKDVFITLSVTEGEKYTFSDVKIAGETLGLDDELNKLVAINAGETFNNERLAEAGKRIVDRLGALGYAFANANPVPDVNRDKRTVGFTLFVDPGRRVYVRRINITGNTRTRDEVIRREVRQFEGGWYDSEKLKLSRDRINRLSYFKDVTVDTNPVAGSPDQVDLTLNVAERPTGNLLFGVGFSSTDKVIITASINQPNFLGTGTSMGLEVNTSRLTRTIALSHVDPYFTDDGISRSIDVYTRTYNPSYLNLGNYRYRTNGAGLRFGVPYTEYDRLSFGAAIENTQLYLVRTGDSPSPRRFIDYADKFGDTSTAYLLTAGWVRDSRDSALTPTRGRYQFANLDVTLPVGEVRYARMVYGHQYYMPIAQRFTLAFNTEIGYGVGLGGRDYPLFKNFFAGGIGSVRGFAPSTLGYKCTDTTLCPRAEDQVPLGGNRRLIGSAEFFFPVPGGSQTDQTFRLFTFVDAGYVWAEHEKVQLSDMRMSTGLGLSWFSPFGPLKFSLGVPIKKKEGDRTQRLQFQIGTGF